MTIFPCPFCLCHNVTVVITPSGNTCKCNKCLSRGPSKILEDDAIEDWNFTSRAVFESNKRKDAKELVQYLVDEITNHSQKIIDCI